MRCILVVISTKSHHTNLVFVPNTTGQKEQTSNHIYNRFIDQYKSHYFAPASTSSATVSVNSFFSAIHRAEWPFCGEYDESDQLCSIESEMNRRTLSTAFKSTPVATSNLIISDWPRLAAWNNAPLPLCADDKIQPKGRYGSV